MEARRLASGTPRFRLSSTRRKPRSLPPLLLPSTLPSLPALQGAVDDSADVRHVAREGIWRGVIGEALLEGGSQLVGDVVDVAGWVC